MPTTDEVEVNGVPFRRAGSRTNTFAAMTDYRFTKFTTLSTRYDMTWVEFDQPDVFLTGGWIHALRNELSHAFTERLSLGAEYSYRTASLDEGTRDFGFQDIGGVLRFVLGPHTSGSTAAGFAVLHDRNNDRTVSGPFVRLSVAHAFERATIGAGYSRQYVPTFGFGGATSSQELGGHLMVPFARSRLYAQAAGDLAPRHAVRGGRARARHAAAAIDARLFHDPVGPARSRLRLHASGLDHHRR